MCKTWRPGCEWFEVCKDKLEVKTVALVQRLRYLTIAMFEVAGGIGTELVYDGGR
jgi:hypothetical protein